MSYKIVIGITSSELVSLVRQHLEDGWKPQGGAFCKDGEIWAQAMVHDLPGVK